MRGLVSCTGIDYCYFALVDTKGTGTQDVTPYLEKKVAG